MSETVVIAGQIDGTHEAHGEHVEHYDPAGDKMGFWLFLFTEVILFGILFLAFAIYLNKFPFDFREGSSHLDVPKGALNTVILLTSSLTMALAIAVLQRGKKGLSILLMGLTVLCAVGFCIIKSFEWGEKFEHGIYLKSPVLGDMSEGLQLYYGLYFVMTGTHALHVIIGAILIITVMVLVGMGKVHKDRIGLIENAGLFWHLVDLVWIFLFPLFYLIG